MKQKKEARKPVSITGNNETHIVLAKIGNKTKRKRVIRYQLERKWFTPNDVLTSIKNNY